METKELVERWSASRAVRDGLQQFRNGNWAASTLFDLMATIVVEAAERQIGHKAVPHALAEKLTRMRDKAWEEGKISLTIDFSGVRQIIDTLNGML